MCPLGDWWQLNKERGKQEEQSGVVKKRVIVLVFVFVGKKEGVSMKEGRRGGKSPKIGTRSRAGSGGQQGAKRSMAAEIEKGDIGVGWRRNACI